MFVTVSRSRPIKTKQYAETKRPIIILLIIFFFFHWRELLQVSFFVAANILSRKTRVCRHKHVFVATKHVFCPDQSMLAATKMTPVAPPANDNSFSVTALKQHRGRRCGSAQVTPSLIALLMVLQVVANYYGNKKRYEPVEGKSIHWAGGRTDAPPDTPRCGFDGSKCPPEG